MSTSAQSLRIISLREQVIEVSKTIRSKTPPGKHNMNSYITDSCFDAVLVHTEVLYSTQQAVAPDLESFPVPTVGRCYAPHIVLEDALRGWGPLVCLIRAQLLRKLWHNQHTF